MNLNKPQNNPTTFPPPKQPQFNLHQAFTTFHHNFSSFLTRISTQNPSSLKTHLQSTLSHLQAHARQALALDPSSRGGSHGAPSWARIAPPGGPRPLRAPRRAAGMSAEAIEERLAGVPVYALSNANEEFVLVSGAASNKSLVLFCFKREDADALLRQVETFDPTLQNGSKVVAVALNKVFQLKVDGVSFRLIPETSQVKHAIEERENSGSSDDGFFGVPVFQAKSLILRSQNKSYRPAFFRKEDLEKSLLRASREQGKINPGFRKGEIEVTVLEDVIKGMKESSSKWDDIVFIPPGFDVSTNTTDANK